MTVFIKLNKPTSLSRLTVAVPGLNADTAHGRTELQETSVSVMIPVYINEPQIWTRLCYAH
jgi:hypothetical protein